MKARHHIVRVAAFLMLVPVGAALGGAMPATANIIQVQATSAGHTATFDQIFPVSSFTDSLSWTMPAPMVLSDDAGAALGTIDDLTVTFNADPQVDLKFLVTNNDLNNPIVFTITTATISFSPIVNPLAAASASMTVVQGILSPPGGYTMGLFPDGKAYQARYSTDAGGIINTQTVFANLVSDLTFGPGLGTSATENYPLSDMTTVSGPVSMMESQFKFLLSPGDQASGTSAFLVTPEPATLVVLALGGLMFAARRRS